LSSTIARQRVFDKSSAWVTAQQTAALGVSGSFVERTIAVWCNWPQKWEEPKQRSQGQCDREREGLDAARRGCVKACTRSSTFQRKP
jgi:hypothetical protein